MYAEFCKNHHLFLFRHLHGLEVGAQLSTPALPANNNSGNESDDLRIREIETGPILPISRAAGNQAAAAPPSTSLPMNDASAVLPGLDHCVEQTRHTEVKGQGRLTYMSADVTMSPKLMTWCAICTSPFAIRSIRIHRRGGACATPSSQPHKLQRADAGARHRASPLLD